MRSVQLHRSTIKLTVLLFQYSNHTKVIFVDRHWMLLQSCVLSGQGVNRETTGQGPCTQWESMCMKQHLQDHYFVWFRQTYLRSASPNVYKTTAITTPKLLSDFESCWCSCVEHTRLSFDVSYCYSLKQQLYNLIGQYSIQFQASTAHA